MDALALLCNLHANGPATLRLLRQSGLDRLESFEHMDAAATAALLGCSTAAAERFLVEARMLAQRVGGDLLEEEDEDQELAVQIPEDGGFLDLGEKDELDDELPVPHSSHELAIDDVLTAWRERDAADPPGPPSDVLVPTPRRSQGATRTPLSTDGVEGLGEAEREQLARFAILTVEDLIEADPLALSRGTGLRYTSVMHLQFLARRVRPGTSAAPRGSAGAQRGLEPGRDPGSAGPFA